MVVVKATGKVSEHGIAVDVSDEISLEARVRLESGVDALDWFGDPDLGVDDSVHELARGVGRVYMSTTLKLRLPDRRSAQRHDTSRSTVGWLPARVLRMNRRSAFTQRAGGRNVSPTLALAPNRQARRGSVAWTRRPRTERRSRQVVQREEEVGGGNQAAVIVEGHCSTHVRAGRHARVHNARRPAERGEGLRELARDSERRPRFWTTVAAHQSQHEIRPCGWPPACR